MSEDYQAVKEVILNMLASPLWQNQYNSFVEEYCIFFDEDEENSMQQNNLFKQFQTEMAAVYDSFFNSLGLDNSDDLQIKVIKEILNSDGDDEIDIAQLVALGDFQVFKAEMAYQNKKREIAAYEQLIDEEDDDEIDDDDNEEEQNEQNQKQNSKLDTLKIKLEYEQLQEQIELQQAMQLSLDTPNEQKMNLILQLLEVIQARLTLLDEEENGIQQKQIIQQNDRKQKLQAQLNRLPDIDLKKEFDILQKIKSDAQKIL